MAGPRIKMMRVTNEKIGQLESTQITTNTKLTGLETLIARIDISLAALVRHFDYLNARGNGGRNEDDIDGIGLICTGKINNPRRDNEPPEEHIGAEDADHYESLIMQRVLSAQMKKAEQNQRHTLIQTKSNQYSFLYHDKKIVLHPMSPKDILHADVAKAAKSKGGSHKNAQSAGKKTEINLKTKCLLATKSDINELIALPSVAYASEYSYVFPKEVPPGLPPVRGIEHQIDLITGASLPNCAPYRTNPEETKEVQRQIQELHDKRVRMLDDMLDKLSGSTVFSKVDLHSSYHQDHLDHLHFVFNALCVARLFGNLEKCCVCTERVPFLGYVVTPKGNEVDQAMVEAIQSWPTPKTVSQVRSFLRLAGFYRRFMRDFSTIAAPLNELTKKGVPFTWSTSQENAFHILKDKLTHAPLLQLPDLKRLLNLNVMLVGLDWVVFCYKKENLLHICDILAHLG
uniref:OSJNBa0094P09.15 protein n=1 Tax=Oryza sativa subsp. japonica TaxID=39947 RepID=Q7XLL2_ORYSJ|nr:OSJNBa0094P09.15 [Oryza sativa Japonica Group]